VRIVRDRGRDIHLEKRPIRPGEDRSGGIPVVAVRFEYWSVVSTITTVIANLFQPRGISATTGDAFLVAEGHDFLAEGSGPGGSGPGGSGAGSGGPVGGGPGGGVVNKNVAGYQGDGGAPTDALLSSPAGVAVLDDGSIVVADTGNGAVRRIG
jgi:NHL repeat